MFPAHLRNHMTAHSRYPIGQHCILNKPIRNELITVMNDFQKHNNVCMVESAVQHFYFRPSQHSATAVNGYTEVLCVILADFSNEIKNLFVVTDFLLYSLELQSWPLQPREQSHLSGAIHRPFIQPDEQRATNK